MTRAAYAPALAIAPLLGLALAAGAARAVTGGDLDVLTQGEYVCELPGDAGDLAMSAGRQVPTANFAVISDSSYRIGARTGVYLLTGDRVAMTSGPGRGRAFHFIDESTLLALAPDGSEGPMRCVRSVQRLDAAGAPAPCPAAGAANAPTPALTRPRADAGCGKARTG